MKIFSGHTTLRRIFLVAAALAGLLCVICLSLILVLTTPAGLRMVERSVNSLQKAAAIAGLQGNLLGTFSVRHIDVADTNGTWLTVEDLDCQWIPADLFLGKLHIPFVRIKDVNMTRLPAGSSSPVSPQHKQSSSPISSFVPAFTLADLHVEKLLLATGTKRPIPPLTLSGSADLASLKGPGRLALSLHPLDEKHPLLNVSAKVQKNTLECSGTFEDPTGAMVSFLAGLPDHLPLAISFQGSGTADRYTGSISATAPRLGATKLDLQWAVPEQQGILQGKVTLEPSGLLGTLTDVVGDEVTVDAETGTDEHGQITSKLKLSGDWLTIAASAAIDLTLKHTDTTFTVTAADPNRLTERVGVVLHDLSSLTGSIQGDLDRPVLSCRVSARTLQSGLIQVDHPSISLEAKPSAPHKSLDYSLTLHTTANDVTLPDILHSGPINVQTMLAGLGSKTIQAHLNTDSKQMDLKGSGSFTPETGILAATFSGDAKPGTLFSPSISPLPESISFDGTVQGDLNTFNGTATLQTILGRFTRGPAPLDALLGPETSLDLAAELHKDTLNLQSFTLTGANVQGNGNASLQISGGTYQSNLTAQVQTGALGPELAPMQEISITSRASGATAHSKCTVSARPKKSSVFGLPLEAVILNADLDHMDQAPSGTWNLRLATAPGPLLLAGDVDLKNGIAIPRGTLQGLDLDGTFAVNLPADTPRQHVDYHITSSSLKPLGALLDQPLQGSLEFRGTYDSTPKSARVDLSGRAQNIAYDDIFTASSVDLLTMNMDPGRPEQATLALQIKGLRAATVHLDNAQLRTTPQGQKLNIFLNADGTKPAPLRLSLTGQIHSNSTDKSLRLDTFKGEYNGFPIALAAPTELHRKDALLELTPTTLHLADATIYARVHMDNTGIDAKMDLTNSTLTSLQSLVPFPLPTGTLNANAALTGPLDHPRLLAEMIIEKLAPTQSNATDNGPSGTLKLTVENTSDSLKTTASLDGLSPDPLRLKGEIPFAFSLRPFQASIPETTPFTISVKGDVDLAKINDLAAVPDLDLSGMLKIDASATGTMTSPELGGTIRMEKSRAEYVRTGTLLEEMQGQIRLNKDTIILDHFSATDGDKGTFTARGNAILPVHAPLSFDVSTALNGTRLISNDTVTATVGGTCRVHGNENSIEVKGDLLLPKARLNISRNPDPAMVPLKIRETNVLPENRVKAIPKTSPPANLNLDVTVTIPGQLFVRGRGLESEWKGKLQVTGMATQPIIRGKLESIRGSLGFAGRELDLTSGTIRFAGASPPNPVLNIVTSVTIKSTEVQVKIQGSATKPELSLESTLDMPHDEILALLLFGESANKLTPFQALQLANTIRTLKGSSGGGFDPLGYTRTLLGVDTITIGAGDEDEGMQVGVGKYLTDTIYMELKKGLTSDEDAVSIEMDVTPNIGVETEVGTDSTGKVGVYWKRDY